LDEVFRIRKAGFDFGEIALGNASARRMWWELGLINGNLAGGFFLMAHGPLEEYPNDTGYLWDHYLPGLMATVDTARRMNIRCLNTHLLMNTRIVSSLVLAEKLRALKDLVAYGKKYSVSINLENTSEAVDDLGHALNEIQGFGLTLDVGHANLHGPVNQSISIIEKHGRVIRHVHLHDNMGGHSQADDLHLPIGEGMIDFTTIMTSLSHIGYDGTLTLEVKPEFQVASLARIKSIVGKIRRS